MRAAGGRWPFRHLSCNFAVKVEPSHQISMSGMLVSIHFCSLVLPFFQLGPWSADVFSKAAIGPIVFSFSTNSISMPDAWKGGLAAILGLNGVRCVSTTTHDFFAS